MKTAITSIVFFLCLYEVCVWADYPTFSGRGKGRRSVKSLALTEKMDREIGLNKQKKQLKARLVRQDNKMADLMINKLKQGEPGINDLQQEALKYAQVNPEKVTDWMKRAGKAAWLPEFRVRLITRQEDDRNYTLRGGEAPTDQRSTDFDMLYELRATWQLDQVVFNRNQLMVNRQALGMYYVRDKLLIRVNQTYFERLRIKANIKINKFNHFKSNLNERIKLAELTAILDGLTGGYFSRASKKLKVRNF